MAKKEELLFNVPFKIRDNYGYLVIDAVKRIPAVSIEQAENRVAFLMVRPRRINPKSVYPGYSIEFGDTKTIDGRYIHAPKKIWQRLQDVLLELGLPCSPKDAKYFQKYYDVKNKNLNDKAKLIVSIIKGGM